MTWLRRLIIAFPIVLLAFFGVAFVSVKWTAPRKLNQLTIGSIGEAKILNPILATTSSDGEVNDEVFEGLVRYDENINLVGALAERWETTQQSTLFFDSPAAAGRALAILNEKRADWPKWNVTDARWEDQRVTLRLSQAGTSFQEPVLRLLDAQKPLPVSFARVSLNEGAKFEGQPAKSREVMNRIETEVKLTPGIADRVHSDFVNTSGEFDLVVVGDAGPVVKVANALLQADRGKAAIGQCEIAEQFPVLNEPEIVFHLRKGVRWQDGEPFTARDVEFTYRMLMDESVASPRRSDYELVRSLRVVDDHTVRVVYRKPYAPCVLSWSIGMLPRHLLEGKNTQWWAQHFNRSPIGTGPYRFGTWKSGEYIRLNRNDHYWEGQPHIDSVAMRVIPDLVALRLLFETGGLDYWGIAPYAIKSFLDNPRYDTFSRIAPAFEYVGWNLKRPMFQDIRVRQALAHAVNVPQIIEYIFYGQGVPSTGPFPPQMWFSNPNVKPFDYDPAKAKAMLAEAGWTPGPDGVLQKDGKKFAFTLITNNANELRKDIATLVQADLKKIGIDVDVQLFEWAVFISQYVNKQDFDACVLGWQLGYDYDQYQLWHSSQTKPGMLNFCSYKNPEVDRLLELARSEFDEEKAKESLWKLQEIIYREQPYLFTVVPKSNVALHHNEFRVKRPDDKGGWIEEPIRATKSGVRVYQDWWYRPELKP